MEYKTILRPCEARFVEKKSEFIGYLCPVESEEQALAFINEVRALHRPKEPGNPMVTTVHELPFDLTIDTPQLADGAQPQAEAEVIDVMADSVESDKSRTLRVEAEVRVRLRQCRQRQTELLEDLYSLSGPVLEPVTETLDVHTSEENACRWRCPRTCRPSARCWPALCSRRSRRSRRRDAGWTRRA